MTAGSEVRIVMSVDTEEDNWVPTRERITCANILELPKLQKLLDQFGGRPTYFVSYQVMVDDTACGIIKDLGLRDDVEIGAHLHPWNTPPMTEDMVPRNTMLKNLPPDLQGQKLDTLTAVISDNLGKRPRSFRAGRFGLGTETVKVLIDRGFEIDSSVTPFVDWSMYDDGADHREAPVDPYYLQPGSSPTEPSASGPLLEMPLSSAYTRYPFRLWRSVHDVLGTSPFRLLHLRGVAARTGLLKQLIMTPETEHVADMLRVARRLVERGADHIHMFWHSPTLVPGLNQFAPDQQSVDRLYRRIAEFVDKMSRWYSLSFATVQEAAEFVPERTEVPSG